MATTGAFSRHRHFEELDAPLVTNEGVLSAADRKQLILTNLGVTSTVAELNILDGVTATADEINTAADQTGKADTATATADGLTTGLLTTDAFGKFVTVTSANAAHIVVLPAAGATFAGQTIEMWVGANGFELRCDGTAGTINGLDCKTTNETAIAATHRVRATLVAAETWLLEGDTELGARVTLVPDAVS